jgi:hypothetical protein
MPAAHPTLAVPTYVFSQTSPASTWTITHRLGKYPSVTVVDEGGVTVLAEVTFIDLISLTVTFSEPVAGKAYLN